MENFLNFGLKMEPMRITNSSRPVFYAKLIPTARGRSDKGGGTGEWYQIFVCNFPKIYKKNVDFCNFL